MVNDQRSVTDQLKELVLLADRNGLYDAADWLRARLESARLDQSSKVRIKIWARSSSVKGVLS
jgi:hypothetical protein